MIMVIIDRYNNTVIYLFMTVRHLVVILSKKKSGRLAAIRVNLNMRHQSQLFGQDESRVLMTRNE